MSKADAGQEDHVVFRVTRSWPRDREVIKRSGRGDSFLQVFHLIREDLLPYLGSDNIGFKPVYGTDSSYHATARFFFPKEFGRTTEEVLEAMATALFRANGSGVHGEYEILGVHIGGVMHTASSHLTPGGLAEAGSVPKAHDPAGMAGMIDWMSRSDRSISYIGDGFINETLMRFGPETEAGRTLRYGMVLGMQAVRDSIDRKAGAPDVSKARELALLELGVDVDGPSKPSL